MNKEMHLIRKCVISILIAASFFEINASPIDETSLQFYPDDAASTKSAQFIDVLFECSSCSKLSMFINTTYGLVTADLQCNSAIGEYCSQSLRRCSTRKSYCSIGGRFECNQEGYFPNPFECNVYYNCYKDATGDYSSEEHVCPLGTSYNAKTYKCDQNNAAQTCEDYHVQLCPNKECRDAFPLRQNSNIYYVCEEGLPRLYRCVEGDEYVYDAELLSCVRNGTTTTTTTTTTTMPMTIATSEETPGSFETMDPFLTTTFLPSEKKWSDNCRPSGLIHVDYTCIYYYNCSGLPSPPVVWYCRSGRYFDRELGQCVDGKCPYFINELAPCSPGIENGSVPVQGTCNVYYPCKTSGFKVNYCLKGQYFDRSTNVCEIGDCPYTDLLT